MRRIKGILTGILISVLFTTCITPFEPEIREKEINKYVVSGQVSDNRDFHTISVSKASSVNEPQFIPVRGCSVRIVDDSGRIFPMHELSGDGLYSGNIDRSFIMPGISFKVEITTPEGVNIESDFDPVNQCPVVDSVYFMRKSLTTNMGIETKGIQFYVDLDGENTGSKYFRWELFETWEYHVPYRREWYYDGSIHHIVPPDYSRKICWATEQVKNIYTLTTGNLTENKYQMFPLHFVGNRTSRLAYGYSLLINQVSLSGDAFTYWDQLRINSAEQGGLYEKQPLSVAGNMHNRTNPDEDVLGFFSAVSVRSKRIFIKDVENLDLDFETYCNPAILRKGLSEFSPEDFPAFLMGDERGFYMIYLGNECVDCLSLGGMNIKPEFWPE